MPRIIGVGWCVMTRERCGFSQGHGRDGRVRCLYDGDCLRVFDFVSDKEFEVVDYKAYTRPEPAP